MGFFLSKTESISVKIDFQVEKETFQELSPR